MSTPTTHVLDLLQDHLHALLPPERSAEVEKHCAECPSCRAALDEARIQLAAIKASLPPVEASNQLVETTLREVNTVKQRRTIWVKRYFWTAGSLAAAAALVLLSLYAYFLSLKPDSTDLIVLAQAEYLPESEASLHVQVVDRIVKPTAIQTNPLANIPVTVLLQPRGGIGMTALLAHFNTDATGSGLPHFTLPAWDDGEYELRIVAQVPGHKEELTKPVKLARSAKIMVTSDKPVYQPGQEIHVRALALRQPDLRPLAGQPAIFTLIDPKGNVVFKKTAPTSPYGIVSMDCPLATEVVEGAHTIVCRIGALESRLAIEIKRYVLPRFKVEIAVDRPYYTPGVKAKATVTARYFHGEPVKDADVAITLLPSTPGAVPLEKRKTDELGQIRFDVPIVDKAPQDRSMGFVAEVTDVAGLKESARVERLVTEHPIRVHVLPEGGVLARNVSNRVYLLVREVSGSPIVNARLAIGQLDGLLKTDRNGLAWFDLKGANDWADFIKVHVLNESNEEIASVEEKLPHLASRGLTIRPDKGVYSSGDVVNVKIIGAEGTTYIDVVRRDKNPQTILSISCPARASIQLPPGLSGTLQLFAYTILPNGGSAVASQMIYVQAKDELIIHGKLASRQAELHPGGKASVRFALTDRVGKPCPGALSLSAVDEAVYSVLPQAPGSEKQFYTVDSKLLGPVYALAAWAPGWKDEQPKEEREHLERALFSATATRQVGTYLLEDLSTLTAGAHTLIGGTWKAKASQVSDERESAFHILGIVSGWAISLFLFLACIAVLLALPQRVRDVVDVWRIFAIVVLVILIFAMLPRVQKVRESSGAASRAMDVNEAFMMQAPAGAKSARAKITGDVGMPMSGKDSPNVDDSPSVGSMRQDFPETLLWRPQVITDDQGRYTLDLPLADSITTWRLSASAVTLDGRLGSSEVPIPVKQDFFLDVNLPVTLTRNDEVEVPVTVHNDSNERQSVKIRLIDAPWFTCLDGAERTADLMPRQTLAVRFRLKALKAGLQELVVDGGNGNVRDSVRRDIEVVADGRRVEKIYNGNLQTPFADQLIIPDSAIEGSVRAYLKLYPSGFSQLVEGLNNIYRMPSGCFEQTSSSTYPNVLALDYLRRTGQSRPEDEAKAKRFIQQGYQRLLTFEVNGGGFDWYGHGPANVRLSAYGLMEFTDMARVHEVDPRLLTRTRTWLLSRRQADGSWGAEPVWHPTRGGNGPVMADDAQRLSATAYAAWAVFYQASDVPAGATRAFLLNRSPKDIEDPYTLALVCNALLAIDPSGADASPYLEHLETIRKSIDGKFTYWSLANGGRTGFYGAGESGNVETTALAVLALMKANRSPATINQALAWIVSKKDQNGTWYSTQATVLALKALLSDTSRPKATGERRIEVKLGTDYTKELVIPTDQSEVMQLLDLTPQLAAGVQKLTVTEKTTIGLGYQLALRYHLPAKAEPSKLTVALDYSGNDVKVGEVLTVRATIGNTMKESARMLLVELPVPPGFVADTDALSRLVPLKIVDKVEIIGRKINVYISGLEADSKLVLPYQLTAVSPVKVTAPAAHVYEYYAPDREGYSAATMLTVSR